MKTKKKNYNPTGRENHAKEKIPKTVISMITKLVGNMAINKVYSASGKVKENLPEADNERQAVELDCSMKKKFNDDP